MPKLRHLNGAWFSKVVFSTLLAVRCLKFPVTLGTYAYVCSSFPSQSTYCLFQKWNSFKFFFLKETHSKTFQCHFHYPTAQCEYFQVFPFFFIAKVLGSLYKLIKSWALWSQSSFEQAFIDLSGKSTVNVMSQAQITNFKQNWRYL